MCGTALAQSGTEETSGEADTTEVESVVADTASSTDAVSDTTAATPEGEVSESGVRVLRAYVCKGIEESEPAEAGRSFLSPDDGVLRLCCFSEVATAREDTILHVWYWGDREMARVPLEVRGPRWRTWSSKRIIEEWRGDWHVDIIDADGAVLKRLEFSIE